MTPLQLFTLNHSNNKRKWKLMPSLTLSTVSKSVATKPTNLNEAAREWSLDLTLPLDSPHRTTEGQLTLPICIPRLGRPKEKMTRSPKPSDRKDCREFSDSRNSSFILLANIYFTEHVSLLHKWKIVLYTVEDFLLCFWIINLLLSFSEFYNPC